MTETTAPAAPTKGITHYAKAFDGFIKTLELKIFHGALWQKHVSPNPGAKVPHIWVPVENQDATPEDHQKLTEGAVAHVASNEAAAAAAAAETPPAT